MFRYSKEKIEFIYSIFLLILIPLLIGLCALLFITSMRGIFEKELRQNATAINGAITVAVGSDVANVAHVNEILLSIKDTQDNLQYTDILITTPTRNEYRVIASTDSSHISTIRNEVQYGTVVNQKRSVTQETDTNNTRAIHIVTPLYDNQDRVLALVESHISTKRADAILNSIFIRVMMVTSIIIVAVVLLLLNHFKLVEYTLLFRKIKEVDELKSDFLSVISRELRDPVTVIRAVVENIRNGEYGRVDERVNDSLLHVTVETDRMNKLVDDITIVSDIEQGRIEYEMSPLNVSDIVEDVVQRMVSKAAAKDVRLLYKAPQKPVHAELDKDRFADIMKNLIDNAIKYSRRGEVVVYHKDTKDMTVICVKDSGIGISASARERLFKRFYRIEDDKTRDIPGTGLGLWIVQQYVNNMNGDIQIDSLEGKGSEFSVSFPRIEIKGGVDGGL